MSRTCAVRTTVVRMGFYQVPNDQQSLMDLRVKANKAERQAQVAEMQVALAEAKLMAKLRAMPEVKELLDKQRQANTAKTKAKVYRSSAEAYAEACAKLKKLKQKRDRLDFEFDAEKYFDAKSSVTN